MSSWSKRVMDPWKDIGESATYTAELRHGRPSRLPWLLPLLPVPMLDEKSKRSGTPAPSPETWRHSNTGHFGAQVS